MTKKEKLYQDYLFYLNNLSSLKGEPIMIIDVDSPDFKSKTKKYNIVQLSHMIRDVQDKINEEELKVRRERFYETATGKTYKDNMLSEIENLEKGLKEWFYKTKNDLSFIFVSLFSDNGWEATSISDAFIQMTYIKGRKDDGKPIVDRSLTFSLYIEKKIDGTEKVRASYPSYFPFDLLNDDDMKAYITGMTNFFNSKEAIDSAICILKKFNKKNDEIFGDIRKYEEKLRNPDIPEDFNL